MDRQAYLDGKISHDDYYKGLAKEKHIALRGQSLHLFNIKSIDHLKELYNDDPNLNNIPLALFDKLWIPGFTKAETTCLYKALLKELALGEVNS